MTPEATQIYEAIYARHVQPGSGGLVPHAAFCDASRAVFLDYLGKEKGILMAADVVDGQEELLPVTVSQNLLGWDRPRHVAFRRGAEAIPNAILDRHRLEGLRRPGLSAVTFPFADPRQPAEAFYFGVDYRALTEGPWRQGIVSLYSALDFPDDLWTRPFVSSRPNRPLAKVAVEPTDWPLLSRVEGVDHASQGERMRESFQGFPRREDDEVHPGRRRRSPAKRMRRHLDRHLDRPVDLVRLGHEVGLSPSAALRTFRAVYGQSQREYGLRQRTERAKALLQRRRSIGEVAAETGFCDQSHLTAAFSRVFGLTPGAYLRTQESP